MSADEPPDPARLPSISYSEFGHAFFVQAVSTARIEAALAGLAGRPVDVGPRGIGPVGRLVRVRATGQVGEPDVAARPSPTPASTLAYGVTVPVSLQIVVELGPDRIRYDADLRVRLHLTARPARPLLIVIDVAPPTADDVEVVVRADGVRASLLQVVASVDAELVRAATRFVTRELDSPRMRAARVIDVGARIGKLA